MSEPTLGELLAPTGLPGLLDQTPAQLRDQIAGMLPPLPALPVLPAAPELPALALPALDSVALLEPINRLLGTFGTGVLPGGGADPVSMLTGLADTLEAGAGAAAAALGALDGLWTGESGPAAAAKSAIAAGNGTALAAQGTAMAGDVQAGLAVVAAGLGQLQAVAVKTAGLLAATMPVIMTPPGQAAALGLAAEGLAEAMAVVAATRAQLAAPTAKLAVDGVPIAVTVPPLTPGQLGDLITAGMPLVCAGLQAAAALADAAGAGPDEQAGAVGPDGPSAASSLAPAALAPAALTSAAAPIPGALPAGAGAPVGAPSGANPLTPTLRAAGLESSPVVAAAAVAEPALGAYPDAPGLSATGATPSDADVPGWTRPIAGGATTVDETPPDVDFALGGVPAG